MNKKLINLIKEDHIGNPIRYFLYLESSGNRINHGYHLYILEKEFSVFMNDVEYRGKIDRIDILEDGDIQIIDNRLYLLSAII